LIHILFWKISIKAALGKLFIDNQFETVIDDPFDRIIISQAIVENMDIISRDDVFDNYLLDKEVKRIW